MKGLDKNLEKGWETEIVKKEWPRLVEWSKLKNKKQLRSLGLRVICSRSEFKWFETGNDEVKEK